jgi:hypothetical protein
VNYGPINLGRTPVDHPVLDARSANSGNRSSSSTEWWP